MFSLDINVKGNVKELFEFFLLTPSPHHEEISGKKGISVAMATTEKNHFNNCGSLDRCWKRHLGVNFKTKNASSQILSQISFDVKTTTHKQKNYYL